MNSTLSIFPMTDEEVSSAWDELHAQLQTEKHFKWIKEPIQRRERDTDSEYFIRFLCSYLTRKAMRELGQNGIQDASSLSLHLLLEVYEEAEEAARKAVDGGFHFYLTKITEYCDKAATWALSNFDADKYREIQANARRAGSATIYGLEHFLEIREMTPTEASKHLKCSRTTVYKLRERFAHIDVNTGEVTEMGQGYKEESADWPATAKQKAFGKKLERDLQIEGAADWSRMSVAEASDRINALVALREAESASGSLPPTEAQIDYGQGMEDALELPRSDWEHMGREEASARINELIPAYQAMREQREADRQAREKEALQKFMQMRAEGRI